MLSNLTGWHAIIILAVILLVFGSTKLPALAKSVGQSMRILKDEVADGSRTEAQAATATPATAATPATPATPATTASSPADGQAHDTRTA